MPKPKRTKTRRTKKLSVEIAPKVERKRNPPSSAFKEGNPYRFEPGQSGNPSGGRTKDEHRLVSKAMKVQLNTRAPDAIAKAMQLPRGSSWAQCLSMSLIRRGVSGDMSAAQLIIQTVEGLKSKVELIDETEGSMPRRVEIVFQEADHDGRLLRTLPKTIDGHLADDPGVVYTPPPSVTD